MRRAVIIALAAALAGGSTANAATKKPAPIIVRGGWLNDLPCLSVDPQSLRPRGSPPSSITLSCTGTTLWNGGWTGRTVLKVTATIDARGNITGTADEWFYGVYTPDNSVGGLHWVGRFGVQGGQFWATARIVGGTCSFAGSRGSGSFDGYQLNGGYTFSWIRPVRKPAPATCNPLAIASPR